MTQTYPLIGGKIEAFLFKRKKIISHIYMYVFIQLDVKRMYKKISTDVRLLESKALKATVEEKTSIVVACSLCSLRKQ